MGTETTVDQTTTIPGIGGQEQGARNILQELMSATGQLGDLSALASGQLQLSPSDTALLDQIQRLSGDASRLEMGRNLDFATGDLEEQLLARGVEGGSIEGLEQGLLRTEALHGLNQSTIEGQSTRAEQARQQVFDRGNLQLNANQLILNRILQSAGGLASMGLNERMAQPNVNQVTNETGLGAIAGTIGELGGMAMGAINPLSSLAGLFGSGGSQVATAGQINNIASSPRTLGVPIE